MLTTLVPVPLPLIAPPPSPSGCGAAKKGAFDIALAPELNVAHGLTLAFRHPMRIVSELPRGNPKLTWVAM